VDLELVLDEFWWGGVFAFVETEGAAETDGFCFVALRLLASYSFYQGEERRTLTLLLLHSKHPLRDL
jgi:hypothetical protein